ncbi:unnamed protein product [Orchesella dallaii]|uniref:Ubiquitin-like protease family profile domain-containing protein n=1 Tax=Orchesella dallaii TaxID=48710 RepID=A0ABP1PW70_9HEXA
MNMEERVTEKRKRDSIHDDTSEEEKNVFQGGSNSLPSDNETAQTPETKKVKVGAEDEDEPTPTPSCKYVVAFAEDWRALSTNPEEILQNIRTPFKALNLSDQKSDLLEPLVEDSTMVVSPEFAVNNKHGQVKKTFKYSQPVSNPGEVSPVPIEYVLVGEVHCNVYILPDANEPEVSETGTETRTVMSIPQEAAGSSKETSDEKLVVAKVDTAGILVTLRSIKNLAPEQELDDDLVDFGIYDCIKEFPDALYLRGLTWVVYLFKPEYPMSDDRRNRFYTSITKLANNINLLSKKYIILPICRDFHWLLVIICNPFPTEDDVKDANSKIDNGSNPKMISKHLYKKWREPGDNTEKSPVIYVLDSKYKCLKVKVTNPDEFHDDTVKYVMKGLRALHQTFWEKTGSKITVVNDVFQSKSGETRNSIPYYSLDVPEQVNGKDCGVYIIAFAKKWFEEKQRLGSHSSMINQDLNKWFPSKLRGEREKIYQMLLNHCKLHYPKVLPKLVAADPFKFPEITIA